MKKLFLFCFLIFLSLAKAQTNVYHPLPSSNATWCQTNQTAGVGGVLVTCNAIYFLDGDTLINSMHYIKVNGNSSVNCPTDFIGACIRQDSANKKVYFVTPTHAAEQILFDFDLHLGDTLPPFFSNDGNDMYVYSVDSVMVGTNYHKRFNIARFYVNTVSVSMIEGVGSTHGIYAPLEGGGLQYFTLNCFSSNGANYPSTSDSCCYNVFTNIKSNHKTALKIYPSPTNNKINIDATDVIDVRLFDVVGKQITSTKEKNIDVSNLPDGVYFIQVQTNQNTTTQKIIVQH